MKEFDLQAVFDNYRPRKDRSVALIFETGELTGDQLKDIHENHGINVRLRFEPTDVAPEGKVVIDADAGEKQPSVRLRGALYVLWEKLGKKGSSESFYKEHMEKLIDFVKSKIEKAENPLN